MLTVVELEIHLIAFCFAWDKEVSGEDCTG